MSVRPESRVTVTVGDGVVTLRRDGQSSPITANILGMDRDSEGNPVRIWLDRIVHRSKPSSYIGWSVSGAVASVLVRNNP